MGKVLVPKNAVAVPQSKEEAAKLITEYGTLLRKIDAIDVECSQKIADINDVAVKAAGPYAARACEVFEALRAYCAANRTALVKGNGKTINFGTGKASWRTRNAKVNVDGQQDDIIKRIEAMGEKFADFLRVATTLNKVAMLNDPTRAELVIGVTIEPAGEDFSIKPFEDEDLKETA